ncbi:diacylglycerol kinase epsilon, partial [Ischnura elegans]|uniref:diacylglycerol kinase epsilon n=1 Tax=Ischnura elegans TaxID=197161 RepID=UPI001ED8B67F
SQLWFHSILLAELANNRYLCIIVSIGAVVKHFIKDSYVPIRDLSKKHSWCFSSLFSKPSYCSICESLITTGEGAYCDCCGVYADTTCIKNANKLLKCKSVSCSDKTLMKHHWIKGNLPLASVCVVCDEECGVEPGLVDYQCCWCQRTVHASCRKKFTEVCDYGNFRSFIVPPTSVSTRRGRRISRRLTLQELKPPAWPDWSPLIVLANRKSGNNDGERIMSLFRRFLNPAQVVDLCGCTPVAALQWCSLLGSVKAQVLVAGGDGTVGWVLNAIDSLQLKVPPSVGIIPLGTGNDLSQVLGWGRTHTSDLDPTVVMEQLENATEVSLDRWKVTIHPMRHLPMHHPLKEMFMYNYMSIGVDAQVTLNFHRARESPFYIFSSRFFNRFLYLTYGTREVMEHGCRDLDKQLEVYIDGKLAVLPPVEALVILNIQSWGGGVRPWAMGSGCDTAPVQDFSDGKLEIMAVHSSFHIAQLQVGLSEPIRIGQASSVKIKLKAQAPMQVDGEPWEQPPAEFDIALHNQALVLQVNEPL